ncbi:MAG: peptide ABC transporter substrate-binding protein [Negativicutes bacterium]|nr:peptide ABC transporter substrate-binding protein [Negativicutes bacterium]
MQKKLAFILTLLLCLVLTACGSLPYPAAAVKEDPAAAKDAGQYLNTYLSADPQTLDISKWSDAAAKTILNNTMEALVRLEDQNGKYIIASGDAAALESNQDGSVWTFHLKDNKWQDGVAVTAGDYVYSLQRSVDPATASPNRSFLSPLLNYTAISEGKLPAGALGVEAVDEKTLVITLGAPMPSFLSILDTAVYYPQRQDKITEFAEKYGTEAQFTCSNGPFQIESWTHGSSLVLVKNEHYWDAAKVSLNKVNYAILPEASAVEQAYTNGELDLILTDQREQMERFSLQAESKHNSYPAAALTYAFFNTEDAVFSNLKIRKAFTLAIDRDEFNEMCFAGLREAATGWVVPGISVGTTNYRQAAGNMIQKLQNELTEEKLSAKDLLISGMQELGLTDDPAALNVTFSLPGTSDWYHALGSYLQQTCQETLGIFLKISYSEWEVFQSKIEKGNYQVGLMAWSAFYNEPYDMLGLFASEVNAIKTGWSNAEFDRLLRNAAVEMKESIRLEQYKQAETILLKNECVVSPLLVSRVNQFYKGYVYGYASLCFSNSGLKYVYTSGRE